MARCELYNTIMLFRDSCLLQMQLKSLITDFRWNCESTKTCSLGETRAVLRGIWQPGHWVRQMICWWKIPIMHASFAFLGRSGLIWYIPSWVFLTLCLFWLCHPFPLPVCLSSLPSHPFITSTPAWKKVRWATDTGYTGCQPAADMPGRAPEPVEVLNNESLSSGNAGQVVSLSSY